MDECKSISDQLTDAAVLLKKIYNEIEVLRNVEIDANDEDTICELNILMMKMILLMEHAEIGKNQINAKLVETRRKAENPER